jgi:hypothetical protein
MMVTPSGGGGGGSADASIRNSKRIEIWGEPAYQHHIGIDNIAGFLSLSSLFPGFRQR